MSEPYELLVRMPRRTSPGGASIRYLTTVGDREYESDPQPLAGASDPAFKSFAEMFSAKTLTERDAALAERDAALAERDEAVAAKTAAETSLAAVTAERDAARAEVERLTAELEAIKNPTDGQGFPILYPSQLRRQLRRTGITKEMVAAVIAAIPDDLARGETEDLWEYSTTFHRDNPLITALGQALGLTVEEIDTLWRAAGAIA